MLRELPKSAKVAIAVFIVIIIALTGYGIYKKATTSGTVAITVATAPSDATVTLNGSSVGQGTIYLAPNKTYDIKVSKDGFSDYTAKKYIDATTNTITAALTPVSDSAKKWSQDNQSQYNSLEAQAGVQADVSGEAFTTRNPITNDLPIENFIYTIGYRLDTSDPSGNSIILTVDAAEGYRNGAIQAIRGLGYDPTKFKIEFKNYTSPFAS
jgi:hypothetical protein